MLIIFQAARRRAIINSACESSLWKSSRLDGGFAIRSSSSSAAASNIDAATASSSGGGKQGSKVRKKAEIFSSDLGKKPKIHLKPSLLSKKSGQEAPAAVARKKKSPEFSTTVQVELERAAAASRALPVEIEVKPFSSKEEPSPYDSEDLQQHLRLELPEAVISAEALFLARSVDLKSLAALEPPSLGVVLPCRNHVVIKLHDADSMAREDYSPMPGCLSNNKVAVVFQYGSVVLFNFHDLSPDTNPILAAVKRHSREFVGDPRKDNYRVVVIPGLDRWSQGGSDKIMVKKLDMDGVRIISLVLGQSIALDHYTRSIDEMLNTFGELNRHMELTGTFNMQRKALFKLVAAANAALADAILRLGLLERSDAAWQSARYDRIWEHMRGDFELDDRFESLEFKIGIIQHNVKFFLDILQNRKSDTLEWIIIFLIAGEICVGVYDILNGAGAI